MDWKLTEEQELLLESVDQFIEQAKMKGFDEEYMRKCDSEFRSPIELIRELMESGIGTLFLPEEHGGSGIDNVSQILVSEKLYRAGLTSTMGAAMAIDDMLTFGSPEQVEYVSKNIKINGGGFTLGITEPCGGSDNSAMQTTAKYNGDGTVTINGTKSFCSGANSCEYILVVARDAEPEDPRRWASMWFVPSNSPGITYSEMAKIGLRTQGHMFEVKFDNVVVPESALVGTKGNGFIQLMKNFEMERLQICVEVLGYAEHSMDIAAAYASERYAFGQAIGKFQLIQEMLLENEIAISTMRNMILETAWKKDNGIPISFDSAMAKYYCAREAHKVIDNCMQIMGGIGYIEDCPISRYWRDCRVYRIGGGTDQIMIHITGRQLLKKYARKK